LAADRSACQLHALTNVSLKKQPTNIHWTGGQVNPRATLGCSNNYKIYNKNKGIYLPAANPIPIIMPIPIHITDE